MIELDSNNHSVFKLTYHLILVVKYRRKVINDTIGKRIRAIADYVGTTYQITMLESNHDQDHMHFRFKAHPNTALSKYINAFKSASSRLVKKEYPQIKRKLWKEFFWSKSYCLLSTGGAPLAVIKKYIESQGERG